MANETSACPARVRNGHGSESAHGEGAKPSLKSSLIVLAFVAALIIAVVVRVLCVAKGHLLATGGKGRGGVARQQRRSRAFSPPFFRATMSFFFEYVSAVIVGVCWESTFCMVFPPSGTLKCDTLLAESLFAVFATFAFPFLVWLFKKKMKRWQTSRLKGLHLMLSMTFGICLSTAYQAVLEGVSDEFCLNQNNHLPSLFFSLGVACVTTAVSVVAQWLIIMRHAKQRDPFSFGSCFYGTLLGSFWTTIGYTWNTTWKMISTLIYQAKPSASSSAIRAAITVGVGTAAYLFLIHESLARRGRGSSLSGGAGGVGGAEGGSGGDSSSNTHSGGGPPKRQRKKCERLLIAAKMAVVVVISFSVNDCSYDFATKYLNDVHGWSDASQSLALYAWAVFLTASTVALARCVGWDAGPRDGTYRQRLAGFGVLTMSWVSAYAWWYPWTDNLDDIEGFGISDSEGNSPWWVIALRGAVSVVLGVVLSAASARLFVWLGRVAKARDQRQREARKHFAMRESSSFSTVGNGAAAGGAVGGDVGGGVFGNEEGGGTAKAPAPLASGDLSKVLLQEEEERGREGGYYGQGRDDDQQAMESSARSIDSGSDSSDLSIDDFMVLVAGY